MRTVLLIALRLGDESKERMTEWSVGSADCESDAWKMEEKGVSEQSNAD
jgi:hypothetical protein